MSDENESKDTYGLVGNEGMLESGEVYDEAELATAYEAGFLAEALKRHQEKMAPQKHPDFDGVHCLDCETEIHAKRLEMGKIRCTDCQEELEKRDKMQGR